MNIFIEYIYNKKRYGLKNYIKYKRFIYQLKRVMPTFGMLWQIADFIKILEKVYFYDNNPHNEFGMYSSLKYNKDENGFCVLTPDVNIKYKLIAEEITPSNIKETIIIEIERLKGNKIKSSMTFDTHDNYHMNELDENLLASAVDITMNYTIKLLKTYYKNKKV